MKTKISGCSFGILQNSLLHDQILWGICSDKVHELLLTERDLTLQKAIDICQVSWSLIIFKKCIMWLLSLGKKF